MEFPVGFATETGPEVCDQDLGALVEAHFLPLEPRPVSEAGEVICNQIYEYCGRAVGFFNAGCEATAVFLGGGIRLISQIRKGQIIAQV